MMHRESRVFIAGHRGLVGSALLRRLRAESYTHLLTPPRAELDLTHQDAVERFFVTERPEYVFLAAAKVGGILANSTYPADFMRSNLLIQTHVIDAAWRHGVRKLLFLGSSCIYPKFCRQPIKEEYLLTAPLEPTNEPYAVAKIAGIKMCQSYRRQFGFNAICLMATNLYGPGDHFDSLDSHVLPALLHKFAIAKEAGAPQVTVWGTGTPRREFLYVDDLADACLLLMRVYDSPEIINVGVGQDISIRDLAALVAEIVGYSGEVVYDSTKPDGTPQKLLDVGRLRALGWQPRVSLREGIQHTYRWYLQRVAHPQQAEVGT